MKNIKNPEIFKKSFDEFRKGDIVKIKFENGKLYKIAGVNPEDSTAILEGKGKAVDFSQLELISNELSDKLFEGVVNAAQKASEKKE